MLVTALMHDDLLQKSEGRQKFVTRFSRHPPVACTPMTKHEEILAAIMPFLVVLIILLGAGAFLYSHPLATGAQTPGEARTEVEKHFAMCHALGADLETRHLSTRQAEQIKVLNDCFDDDHDDPLYLQWMAALKR
jgi:hypothetical protein